MSFVPYPKHIKPARVTAQLVRSDEIFQSPVTGIQQVASRGNAYWRWTIEYRDLSEDERDIVQSFLMSCKGSVNHFKLPDFGNYGIAGTASAYTDLLGDAGNFADPAVWSKNLTQTIGNDYYQYDHALMFENKAIENYFALMTKVNSVSVTEGAPHIARVKINNIHRGGIFQLCVGSFYQTMAGPRVSSVGQMTVSFVPASSGVGFITILDRGNSIIASQKTISDFKVSRCALVSNSENLLTYSNDFSNAAWVKNRCNVNSGGMRSPDGVTDGAWKLYKTSAVNTRSLMYQHCVKPNTEGMYTSAIYAKAAEYGEMQLKLSNATESSVLSAFFYLNSGTHTAVAVGGSFIRGVARMFDVGSGWYKCSISGVTTSETNVTQILSPTSLTTLNFTGNGSDGIWIANAQVREHPFAGHYVPTSDAAIVGTGWQTGSQLYVEGLDPDEIVAKAGSRVEVVTQFASNSLGMYEQSEYKRLTKVLKSSKEGWGIMEIDPPLRNSPETIRTDLTGNHEGETMHNPVIFDVPEMKVRLLGGTVQYIEKPLKLTDVVFDVIEDLTT